MGLEGMNELVDLTERCCRKGPKLSQRLKLKLVELCSPV